MHPLVWWSLQVCLGEFKAISRLPWKVASIVRSSGSGAGRSQTLTVAFEPDRHCEMLNGGSSANSFDWFYHSTINPRQTGRAASWSIECSDGSYQRWDDVITIFYVLMQWSHRTWSRWWLSYDYYSKCCSFVLIQCWEFDVFHNRNHLLAL